ncbi:MAG: phenylacetate--CoA ligase [Bacteroidia bacterium]|nr:phenylacetate--CoA ligase [Bacteroidia bacterium]
MNLIPSIELQPKEKIKAFQEEALRQLLPYLAQRSPYYKKFFALHGVRVEAIRHLEDLVKIPTTTKDDLQRHNWEFLCVPPSDIVEFTSTSGTLGKPVTVGLTEKDLQRLAYNESISFACADGSPSDLYQLMLTLDRQFMAGIAYYEGIRNMGAGLIRVGPGLPSMQWETIRRLNPTALVAVPSFMIKLIEFAQQHGIDLRQLPVRKAVCIGESLRTADMQPNTLARMINEQWDIRLYGTYASTEMQTAFTECSAGMGGHHHPELIIVEILDDQNNLLPAGVAGEVTITSLGVEGMPLLRYKTGDVAAYYDEPCTCGRHTLRLGPVIGRRQQMIKLKGTTLYPPGVFDILNQVGSIQDYVVEVYSNDLGTDELRLHLLTNETASLVEASVKTYFQSRLRVVPELCFLSAADMDKLLHGTGARKVSRFIDNR